MPVDRRQPLRKQHRSKDARSITFSSGANPKCTVFGGCGGLGGTRGGNRPGADQENEANWCRGTASPPPKRAAKPQDGTVPSSHITSIIGAPPPKPKGERPPI